MDRREFIGASAGLMLAAGLPGTSRLTGGAVPAWARDMWNPERPFQPAGRPLRVQPVLMYRIPVRKEATSWKSWGGVQTTEAVDKEAGRISRELDTLAQTAGFGVEIRPVLKVDSPEGAAQARSTDADIVILYPAAGGGHVLRACLPQTRGIIFVRHRSGPVYYWYEALSVKYLRTGVPNSSETGQDDKPVSISDVVVDDMDELLWRLRALYGMKNFVGTRVVALGGPQGKYAQEAPGVARDKFRLDIVNVRYDDFAPRVRAALADRVCVDLAEKWTEAYLALPGTTLATDRRFVVNSFVLYGLFKDLMREHDAPVFTINSCMNVIMPISKTTACLTLSLMNDEGLLAFCESDFVIIPAGILLHHIASKPVFLHNSTFPHNGLVTCAHCTSPRRLDGLRYEPAAILTHYESEYGAAPKVDMPKGQEVTFIDPEYATGRWVGIRGTVEDNPAFEICRSQQDVRIHGNWRRLLNEVRDSHWVMTYGDYLQEAAYVAPRLGITWDNVSET
jgi:L-fucose isomerase-like protein